jgi:hypothetical protein
MVRTVGGGLLRFLRATLRLQAQLGSSIEVRLRLHKRASILWYRIQSPNLIEDAP